MYKAEPGLTLMWGPFSHILLLRLSKVHTKALTQAVFEAKHQFNVEFHLFVKIKL